MVVIDVDVYDFCDEFDAGVAACLSPDQMMSRSCDYRHRTTLLPRSSKI